MGGASSNLGDVRPAWGGGGGGGGGGWCRLGVMGSLLQCTCVPTYIRM